MLTRKHLFLTALTLMSVITFQTKVSANDDNVDTLSTLEGKKNPDVDTLAIPNITKEGMLKSLELLKKQGTISSEDYEKAKAELMKMSESDVKKIKDSAVNLINKDPKKAMQMVNEKKAKK